MRKLVLKMQAETNYFTTVEDITAFLKEAQELPPADRVEVYEAFILANATAIEEAYQ